MKEYKGLTVREFLAQTDAKLQIVTGELGTDLLFLSDSENYHIEWLLDRVIESVSDDYMEEGWLEVKVVETAADISRRSWASYAAYVG